MSKKELRAITVQELIRFLNTVENKNAIVAVACDSEGNGFSPMPNDMFWDSGYIETGLGYSDFDNEPFEGAVPAVVLFGSN